MRTWFFFASAATALAITVSCSSSGPPDTFTPSSGGGGASNTASNNGSGGETQSAHASVSASQPPAADVYGSAFSTIQLEIDYEAGAEPYTGNVVAFGPIWDLTERHLEALYSGANKTFIVPRELSDMQNLGDLGKDSYDGDQIFAIDAHHRDLAPVWRKRQPCPRPR